MIAYKQQNISHSHIYYCSVFACVILTVIVFQSSFALNHASYILTSNVFSTANVTAPPPCAFLHLLVNSIFDFLQFVSHLHPRSFLSFFHSHTHTHTYTPDDSDSDLDDTDDTTVMGSAVAYEEVEASIQALRYGGGEDAASGTVYGMIRTVFFRM